MNFGTGRKDKSQIVVEGEVTTYQPLPHNKDLYEYARSKWRDAEWESLIRLDIKKIETHPENAKLMLVVASAWLQQGDISSAHSYLHRALELGCDKKLAAQILAAGVHNTLGRAAAIAGDQARIGQHFRQAVTGCGSQIERACLARRATELHRLGMEKMAKGIVPAATHSLNIQKTAFTYPAHGITSYAQNFEDVMLWRALWNVENGVYVDVGAWDPVVDSVSKAFYENGWRGVHVEPLPEYAERIRQDRPDESVYQVLLGAETGEKTFFYIPETGLSTASKEIAERHQKVGLSIIERKYPVMTLAQVFDEIGDREIHWLKIDVEGMEKEVLEGWGKHSSRPRIVLLESTEPCSQIPSWHKWQYLIEQYGYRFSYFDGINRFYVHENFEDIQRCFACPPNVFDGFRKAN